jgi:hypothetical protein
VTAETERVKNLATRTQDEVKERTCSHVVRGAQSILASEDDSPEGLADEIRKLREVLDKVVQGEDVRLMLSVMDVLRRAVFTEYRMSKKAERNLSESIANVLRHYATHRYGDEHE